MKLLQPATGATQARPPADGSGGGGGDGADLKKGDIVIVSFGKGMNNFNQMRAKIETLLAKHCWVVFEEGPSSGTRKKIPKENLKLVGATEAAATGADATATAESNASLALESPPVPTSGEIAIEDIDEAANEAWCNPAEVF